MELRIRKKEIIERLNSLWEQEISTFLDLAEGYGQVYAIDELDVISAIDQQSGEVVWVQEDFKRRQLSPPVAFSNYIAVGDAVTWTYTVTNTG